MKQIASDSVDLVLTDPPYFDYIPYSELGHFFTPWFRRFHLVSRRGKGGFPRARLLRTLVHEMPSDSLPESWPAPSVRSAGSASLMPELSSRIRTLMDGGWQAIASALARSGLQPTTAFPLYGDSAVSLHKRDRSISWDAVMVCRLIEPIRVPSIRPGRSCCRGGLCRKMVSIAGTERPHDDRRGQDQPDPRLFTRSLVQASDWWSFSPRAPVSYLLHRNQTAASAVSFLSS